MFCTFSVQLQDKLAKRQEAPSLLKSTVREIEVPMIKVNSIINDKMKELVLNLQKIQEPILEQKQKSEITVVPLFRYPTGDKPAHETKKHRNARIAKRMEHNQHEISSHDNRLLRYD